MYMLATFLFPFLLALPIFAYPAPAPPALASPKNLTLTALVGKSNLSSLECWSMTPALVESTATGTVGALSFAQLGATGNSSYSLFTQLTNAGLHNAPAPQYVMIMTGKGELSFPSTNSEDQSLSGNYTLSAGDILMAADIASLSARGHNTVWQAGTAVLQMPFAGDIPSHVVLYDGGCKGPHM
ncbi:small secreted protein [Mycena vulgaris]|nr:small secreted protein [Mycena vulgaris]